MGIFDALGNVIATGITNKQNLDLTHEQWARDDNAMQRKVADLEAAGLNPVLAAGGSGSPSSAPIPMKSPDMTGLDDVGAMARSVNSAIASKQALDKNAADIDVQRKVAEGHDLDNKLKAATLEANTAITTGRRTQLDLENRYLVDTFENRVAKVRQDLDIGQQELAIAVQDAHTAMNRAAASDYDPQRASLQNKALQSGIDLQGFQKELTKAQAYLAQQEGGAWGTKTGSALDEQNARTRYLEQQAAALAYAVQASKMDAQYLKDMGIPPLMISIITKLLSSAASMFGRSR